MILFVVSLLQIKKYDYKAFLILRGFIILCILTIVLNFMSFTQVWGIIQGFTVLLSVYLFFLALKIHFKGHGVAKYFLMTWSLHLVLIVLFVFQIKGLIHYNSFLINGLFFGSALESTLLSMVIGYKIKTLRLQKETAENNRILKQEEQRKFLIEQAHEIQSPIYFVSNYIGVLGRNFSYMNKLVLLYRDLRACKTDVHLKEQEIQTLEEQINIETVRRELFDGLNSLQLAINRVGNISKNFLTHSKAEEMVNINDCLNDTLSIIRIDLIDTISVDKELDDIPMIQGSKGQIEQVFMNVLKNAVESIQQKETLHQQCIRIRTINTNNKVQVKISDTGTGMNAFVQKNLFVDCYTTKENGHGLGMAISKRIIEDHDGFIHFKSELGTGTEFMIELPIK
jgi:signal transduction histidine kinase